MYHADLSPVGLYIEAGKQTQKLSTKDGSGNFHLLPNGVFWMKDETIAVTETGSFARREITPDHATQSGPMLVIDGELHPRFLKDSNSLKTRNGVGVSKDGKMLHFAISRDQINFWNFGKLFQEKLKTQNALFLDGTVSAIEADGFSQSSWRAIGPIIGVFPKER
ncbi:MAG: phosphodiester glycosidase family protein [Rhizobiaceae bacterium]